MAKIYLSERRCYRTLDHFQFALVSSVGYQTVAEKADACKKLLEMTGFQEKNLTERKKEDSDEQGDDITANIQTAVVESYATTVFKLLITTPANGWCWYKEFD